MDAHSLRVLEFERILDALKNCCLSTQGQQTIDGQEFCTDHETLADRLNLTAAFRTVLEAGQDFGSLDFPDLATLRPRLYKEGVVFESTELSALGRFIVSALRMKRILLKTTPDDNLQDLVREIPDLKSLSRSVFSILDLQGNVLENKIPELQSVRQRIRKAQQGIDSLTRGYLANPNYGAYWQADLPTQRNGRTVLPLKSNFKGRIKGIIHEVSSSGATVYLEPLDVVEGNNLLVREEGEYQRILHRILRELSTAVIGQSQAVDALIERIGSLDAVYARAVYALQHNCFPVQLGDRELRLFDARHPLLGNQAVPVTVLLEKGQRILIVTGPNTGGKTVTVKTVGLLAMMNQFGLQIPAQPDSTMPVFDDIYADIGDEQSIEQSLSTFSAHISNIARIISGSTCRSLVLLDELGAGTDPEEGVAIGMSFLDHFIDTECCVLATTHHGILKNYGYTRQGVENAAMSFDRNTFEPTFHLIMGIPGESHALDIARRSGIPDRLIDRAQSYLKDERGDIAELITKLTEKQKELLVAEQEQKTEQTYLREKRRETDLKELRLKQKEFELREYGVAELRRFVNASRNELDRLVNALETGIDLKDEARHFVQDLDREVKQFENRFEEEKTDLYARAGKALLPGMSVQIKGTGKRGTLLRRGKNQTWIVETDTLRISFPPTELIPVASEQQGETEFSVSQEMEGVPVFDLDLRGMRLEAALLRLQKQLDTAVVRGLKSFSIIHGKGEGILQRGVHDFLAQQDVVDVFSFSSAREGGTGKTIVTLKL